MSHRTAIVRLLDADSSETSARCDKTVLFIVIQPEVRVYEFATKKGRAFSREIADAMG
jgi:hypothetical protein